MNTFDPLEYTVHRNNGFSYFIMGLKALSVKQLRPFVVIPLLINILLFSVAFYFLLQQLNYYMSALTDWLPSFLKWLTYLMWPLTLVTVLVMFSFIFTAFANLIASPFNALLSERLASLMTGEVSNQPFSFTKELPRMFAREWEKIKYYLPKLVIFFLLLFVPVIGSVLWFCFIAWMMAIQYLDYSFDNNQVPFDEMKHTIASRKTLSFSFGVATSVCSMVPLINLLVMPAAVCGATLLWLEHFNKPQHKALYKPQHKAQPQDNNQIC